MENFYSWWDQACKARTCPRTKCVLATSGRIPGASLIDIEWRPWMKMACDQIPIRSRDKPRGSGEQSACVLSSKGSVVPGMFEDEREGRHSYSPIHLPKWNLRRSRSATSFLHNCTRDVKLCSWNLRQARACLWEIIIFPQRKKNLFPSLHSNDLDDEGKQSMPSPRPRTFLRDYWWERRVWHGSKVKKEPASFSSTSPCYQHPGPGSGLPGSASFMLTRMSTDNPWTSV